MSIPDDGIRISNGKWDIYGPHSLRFLRCFGNLITKLFHTHYTFPENLCLEVERYINKYCSDSLIDINFQKLWSLGEILKRPYFKAETVTFDTLRFDGHLPDIDKCFPSIRRLILKTVTPLPNMVCHSPNLEHLTINQSIGQWPEGSNRTVAAFMALNPQLRSFCLRTSHGGLDANVLLCASKNLQNLESLKFSYSRGSFDIPKGRTIHFKSVKKLDLEFTFSVGALPIMPFLFDQLEEFVFGIRFFAVNQNFMDFISKHPGILKLKISGINNNIVMIQTNKIKLAKLLPSLIELDLAHCTFSVDEVIQFVSELKRLKKFRFKFAQQIFCDTLSELLNDEWTLTQSVGRVVELLKIEKPEMEAEVHPQNVENQSASHDEENDQHRDTEQPANSQNPVAVAESCSNDVEQILRELNQSEEMTSNFKERLDKVVQKYDISLVKGANRLRPAASLMPVVRLERIKVIKNVGQTDASKVTVNAHANIRSTSSNQLEQKRIHDSINSESSTKKTSEAQSSEKEPTSERPFRKCRKRTSYK